MDQLRRREAGRGARDGAGTGCGTSSTRAHLAGLAGPGLAGVAQLLAGRGFEVSASGAGLESDEAAGSLRRLGLRVHAGHAPRPIRSASRLLVYAPGVARAAPERLTALRRGVPQASLPEVVERLLDRSRGVAVLGTRGASAAAAMIGWTLLHAGLDPTVLLGSAAPQLGGWGRLGGGPDCVVEAIQIAGQIVPEGPPVAVILNLDPWPNADPERQVAALRRFVATMPADGYVLGAGRNPLIVRALQGIKATAEHLSLNRGCAWWGADLRADRGCYRFRAFHRGRFVVEARLGVPGRRNVLNALAAVAICHRLDVPAGRIKEGLEEFAGLERGLESRGSYRGVTLVDDEARDPWAVAETLAACREVYGRRRLWSVVRPEFPAAWAPFAAAFAAADHVLVAAGDPPDRGEAAWDLVHALASAGVRARWTADLDGAIADLDRHLEPGDVLVTLGAGDVGKVADALSSRQHPRNRVGR